MKSSEQYQVAWIILQAIDSLHCGKRKIAAFLRGSQSKLVQEPQLDQKRGYGALLWHDIPTITGFIAQLEEMQLITSQRVQNSYYSYPILILTDAGKKVLTEKLPIPLQIRTEKKISAIGETELHTLRLFKEGKGIPNIAEERKLAISTIYTHLEHLISVQALSADDCVDTKKIAIILEVKGKHPNIKTLRELKDLLPADITYTKNP